MSINTIKHTLTNQVHDSTTQITTENVLSLDTADNKANIKISIGNAEDLINISSTFVTYANTEKCTVLRNDPFAYRDSNEAKKGLSVILSFMKTDGDQILNSLRAPASSIVLNLIAV